MSEDVIDIEDLDTTSNIELPSDRLKKRPPEQREYIPKIDSFKDYYRKKGTHWSQRPDLAIVPGSFKPPHRGHYEMILKYSTLAREVLVLISAPSAKSERKTKDGKVITPEAAKKILQLYTNHLPNVTIEVSSIPSPVGATYAELEYEQHANKKIALGASKKDDDWKRWKGAVEWAEKKKLPIQVIDPELTAVTVTSKPNGKPYSASNIRDNFDDPDLVKQDLPKHVDPVEVYSILKKL